MIKKILISSLLVIILFFLLKKKKVEHFTTESTLKLSFSSKDSIFMISSDMKNIEQSVNGLKIFNTKNIIHSNKLLSSESGEFSGFIFATKPFQKFKIGFSNIEEDKQNQISHCINIDNEDIQITEKIKGTVIYEVQDIDYCLDGGIKSCKKTKNLYHFNPLKDYLAVILNENRANYLIVKRDEDGNYGSMLIHKGKSLLNFPLKLKTISLDKSFLLPSLLWTKHSYSYDSPVYWTVETQFKDDYNNKKLDIVPMPSYIDEEEFIPAPTSNIDEDYMDWSKYFVPTVKKILITDLRNSKEVYQVDFVHNLDNLYIKLNIDRIFLKLHLDEDTYIFKKYKKYKNNDNLENNITKKNNNELNKQKIIFTNKLPIKSIEILIGDITSHKYNIDTELKELEPQIESPSPN